MIDEEVRRAADQGSKLAVRLAVPENTNLTKTIAVGEELLRFLDARYAFPVGPRFAQLRLVYCTQIRGKEPQKARQGFDQLLVILDVLEKKHYMKFLRGQVYLYRGALKPYNRQDFERAIHLYKQVVKEVREQILQATFQQAIAHNNIAQLFHDKTAVPKAKALLDSIPELSKRHRIRIADRLRRSIMGEMERWKRLNRESKTWE